MMYFLMYHNANKSCGMFNLFHFPEFGSLHLLSRALQARAVSFLVSSQGLNTPDFPFLLIL